MAEKEKFESIGGFWATRKPDVYSGTLDMESIQKLAETAKKAGREKPRVLLVKNQYANSDNKRPTYRLVYSENQSVRN